MSQRVEGPVKTIASGAALAKHRRVKISAGVLQYAGSTDQEIGNLDDPTFADSNYASGYSDGAVRLRTAEGSEKFVAVDAITAGNPFYAAANGKVSASGTVLEGIALETTTADGDIFEGVRRQETSDSAAAGGTTAAAFLVDSDASTPKIELAAQTGGTGDYKGTIKPPATLTGNRTFTLAPDADGTVHSSAVFAATPNSSAGAGNSIPVGYQSVDVGAVTNDANDFIVLPAIASVPIGFCITIACNAGGNFELRTPASSNTKINDVDSDGSQEYLCTDTDIIIVRKATTTGWVAQSLTKLGAVRTAVVPD